MRRWTNQNKWKRPLDKVPVERDQESLGIRHDLGLLHISIAGSMISSVTTQTGMEVLRGTSGNNSALSGRRISGAKSRHPFMKTTV